MSFLVLLRLGQSSSRWPVVPMGGGPITVTVAAGGCVPVVGVAAAEVVVVPVVAEFGDPGGVHDPLWFRFHLLWGGS